uniref:Uncharacterized protein n=1 Tax=Vitis vinifera TaxID=29760 RepID=A5B5C7_VITVI|nr:hypothetical protein VITISV_027200 [Vitis vinifera]
MVGGLQGEEWKFIQKYLKKNIQKSRWQISGSTKDHFAGENEVCEISQTHKRAAKSLRSNKLSSQGCEVGFHLEVLSFQLMAYIGQLQEEIHNTVQKGCEILATKERDEDHGSPEDDDDGSEYEGDDTDGSDAGSNLYKDEDDSSGTYWEVRLNRLDLLSC